MTVVPDTSVLIKWFRQEEVLALQALLLRSEYLSGAVALVVPTLLAYELANVLALKADIPDDRVEQAVADLYDMELQWVEPSLQSVSCACRLAREHGLTVYDATFVALAESRAAVFLTADGRLAARLASRSHVVFLGEYTGANPADRE
ncbi:MAG: type II toxin-antitoxin system VapC family toxin [Anaerolineae bacterium]